MRSRWVETAYWRWLWSRVPWEARWVVVGVLLLGLLGGGWAVASQGTSSNDGDVAIGTGPIVIQTTVERVITVRRNGKIVRKVVPVVKRVRVLQRPGTLYETQRDYVTRVVKTPGGAVIRTVSTVVPLVTTQQITVNGKPRSVTRTEFRPTTQTRTVPLTQTLVATQNVTQTQTTPPVTDTRTTTETKTQTQTVTQTATRTVTDTQLVTVTPDPVTVMRTVTETPDPVTVTRTETDVVTVTVKGDGGGGVPTGP